MKYFKHSASALNEPRIIELIMQHGMEGYGFYFALAELLALEIDQDNLDARLKHTAPQLGHRFGMEPSKVLQIIHTCKNSGLLAQDEIGLHIPCMIDWLDDKTKKPRQAKDIDKKIPYEKIVHSYNTHCTHLAAVKVTTDKRKRLIMQRWRAAEKHQEVEFWERFFEYVNQSEFLTGSNGNDWRADFDWCLQEKNFVKIIEGSYHR